MREVRFILGTGTGTGEVIKENSETVWVRLYSGEIIKRHKEKHRVTDMQEKKEETHE